MSIGRVVLGVLLVCTFVGCSDDDNPLSELPPLPEVVHTKAVVAKNRDPAAVLAALTRLDDAHYWRGRRQSR
ncbi:hypothetical protein [Kribbella deserti]|uniref:Uncharacterized protein n=1 Tax=Kribbella deserti TaxID=1926257 RepID=A0ABV6QE01_9ACTN